MQNFPFRQSSGWRARWGLSEARKPTFEAVRGALENAGFIFLEPKSRKEGGAGVRLKK